MPQNEIGWLLVIGAVFFLIGLLGGGLEVSAVKIPPISKYPRITFSVVGALLIGLAIIRIVAPINSPPGLPTAVATFPNPPLSQTPITLPASVMATSTPELTPTASPTQQVSVMPIFSDDFETNAGVWVIGEQNLTAGTERKSISYSKYVWELTTTSSWFATELPNAPDVSDFELSAEMRLVSGPEDTAYGLLFRSSDAGYFIFLIIRGTFYVGYLDRPTNKWDYPTTVTASSAINVGGPNVLKVVAEGPSIQLFINEQFVRSISDSRSMSGKTGISLHLFGKEGGSAKVEADNFQLIDIQK